MVKYVVYLEKAEEVLPIWHQFCWDEMGKKELTGQNDGAHITKYMNWAHLSGKKKYAYCASGLLSQLDKACQQVGVAFPFSKHSASANYYFDNAKKIGVKVSDTTPQIYDLIIWKNKPSYSGHIESVKFNRDNDLVVDTYAFNTSNGMSGSQREGNGNFERIRDLSKDLGKMYVRGLVGFSSDKSLFS